MYSQGNYNPQLGQGGTHTPMPPPYQQRPPPPHHFQQVPPPVPPPPPPHIGQPGPPIYQHGPPPPPPPPTPPPTLRQGQSYLHPPPPSLHMYQTAQQNSQYASHLGTQNVHLPPPPLPRTDMLQAPPPSRVLPPPPPPSQGQTLCRAPSGGVQGLQHIPPPPPLPTSSFLTSSPYGSFVHSASGSSHLPSMAPLPPPPPPPPSSPPPVPPSPPPTSSLLALNASDVSSHADSDPSSHRVFGSKLRTPDFVDEAVGLTRDGHNASVRDGYLKLGGGSSCEVGSLAGDGSSSKERVMLDLPPPPPKPTDGKVVQKIELFCQFIAKNGPGYEDMARQNESGNPEFDFLFGGQPGSDAAIAHEYFLWMKKKFILACKLDKVTSDSPLRPLGIESSKQPDQMMAAGGSHSPADSDMEMEDDITQSDIDQRVNHSIEGVTCERDFIHNELDLKEQLHGLQTAAECDSAKDFQTPHFGSSRLGEQGSILVSNHEHLTIGRSVSKVHSPIMNSAGVAEGALASNLEKSTTSLADDKSLFKGSTAAEGIDSDKYSGQLMEGGSPFRLLQDYVSDDSSKNDDACLKGVCPVAVSPSVAVGATSLHRDTGINLETDMGSNIPSKTEKGFGSLSKSSMSYKAPELSLDSPRKMKDAVTIFIASSTTNEHVDNKHENQSSISHAAFFEVFQKKDSLGGSSVDDAFISKLQKENEDKNVNSASTSLKVDKFGRLIKEGASDSDSDDVRYSGRRSRGGRSWSRSRSPPDRRRRRRSPRRRRDKRSRSRSRSPRNRRSRSRSPFFRRASELGGDNMRRDKGQIPTCFDYLRGRCHRGASCRYLHHDKDKNDGSRRHRSKQQHLEVPPSVRNSSIHEEIKHISPRVSYHEHDEVKNQEMQLCRDIPGGRFGATKDRNIDPKIEDSANDAPQSVNSNRDGQLMDSDIIKSESSRKVIPKVLETDIVKGELEDPTTCINENCQEAMESHQTFLVDSSPSKLLGDANTLKSLGAASQDIRSFLKNSLIQQSQSTISDTVLQNTDCVPQQTDNSSISESSPDRTSTTSPSKLPASEAFPNMTDIRHDPSQLPPPISSLSQGVNAPHKTQPPKDYNSILQTASASLQSDPEESFPPYMLPNQHSNFSVNSSWTPLPPPPPLPLYDSTVNALTVTPGVSSQFQQNYLPSRNEFGSQTISRLYPTELPTHSQFGEFQHRAYLPMQEPHRPVLHAEDYRLNPSPVYNPLSQQYAGPSSLREDCLTQLPMQGLSASNSYAQGKSHPQSMPYGLHHPQPDSVYNLPGNISSSSRYPPDIVDTNQPPDFGGSRSSSYYNPYVSTFEHPLSSNFSSAVLRQEKDTPYSSKYDASFSLSHAPVDGQGVGSVGSRQATSSPNSARAVGQNFPSSGGDQYDPLFDSIEPSSKVSKKFDRVQKWESTNDFMLRLSGSNKPLDVEENNRKKEVVAVALSTSVDNEEYGETADAEVGAVENGSPSNPVDEANMTAGEIEIDQIKSPGKSKKSKDSRSMKLFKIAVADFVKEVLKPSWRQGNMSKEAFKTIVKKTVDKVSGAMKGHQIPKSKAKIEQYIDSSQRKLTKLVTGYVDKYVKV